MQNRRLDIPLSTYRLQFNKHFTFSDACEILPYLKKLGISHCYSSPILCAKSGSLHGYDITDHSRINPELGAEEGFNLFSEELKKHNMGLILDIVPNHMGVNSENKWWADVLENGQASEYAEYFDINWNPIKKELNGKVLVPVLADHYGSVLASGELKLKFFKDNGVFKLFYNEHAFPINPSSYPFILEHKINVLERILGENNCDFCEFQSIIYCFKNLPSIFETSKEKIMERNREKNINFGRLAKICENKKILNFVERNLKEFCCVPKNLKACKRMHELLENQPYRLAYWRVSTDIINYRRFFDINSLICIKMENENVFESVHSLIFNLIKDGKVHGLRVDHPDGLAEPHNYFLNMRLKMQNFLDADAGKNFYIVAEKILADFEKIPDNWQIHGTTGYEFLNSVNNLFLDKKNKTKFSKIYNGFIKKSVDFKELMIKCKKIIMKTALTSELSSLANQLNHISEKYYATRDYTLNNLRDALIEIISCFPIYRTYICEGNKCKNAYKYIRWAVETAKEQSKSTEPSIFDFIEKTLLCELEPDKNSETYKEIMDFSMKFQQYTAPLMAKGVEDTGFFNYNRLISLNEVGGNPTKFGISTEEFHNNNINRLNNFPYSLIATSTHDTKLSEDVRARISVLSEIPELWKKKINYWSKLNNSKKTEFNNLLFPDKNDEYLFYQALIGIWEDKSNNIVERLENYMIKAAREAKIHTSWINMNSEYENALSSFIRKIMNSYPKHSFWQDFLPFQKEISQRGYINSIAKITLKFTAPGVPDIYQGNELWKYNLVDPDNRNPVDYHEIQKYFSHIEPHLNNLSEISPLFPIESGKLKLFITSSLLNFRQKQPELFKFGNYTPLDINGTKQNNLAAFSRNYKNKTIISIVPRLIYDFISQEKPFPVGEEVWQNTYIKLPENVNELVDIFTGERIFIKDRKIKTGNILKLLPVSVLYSLSN